VLIAQLSEVFKSFGSQELLEDIHWQIREGDRISLVGRNGAGKTTLFRILAGEVDPDRGSVWRRRGAVIASMEQEVRVDDRRTLREEAARGLQHLQDLQQEHAEATRALSALREGDAEAESLLEHYARLQERLEREGGYSFDARIKEVLEGLHFREDDLDRPLIEFSGGQKSRAMLARCCAIPTCPFPTSPPTISIRRHRVARTLPAGVPGRACHREPRPDVPQLPRRRS
jgi:ATP-binding cassette subfamily F protein 3